MAGDSWTSNADASVWTFKIRQGVKFNDGTPMTVDDVVYSFKAQSDPKSSANALSVFGGTLTPDGVQKVDNQTVAFHLVAPNNGFLDAVSEDNYNMIIVPNNFDFGNYQKQMPGTGRFMMSSYTPTVGEHRHSSGTRITGERRRCRRRSNSPTMPTNRPWRRPSRRARSTRWTSSRWRSARSC